MKRVAVLFALLAAGCATGYVRRPVDQLPRLKAEAVISSPQNEEPGYIRISVPASEISRVIAEERRTSPGSTPAPEAAEAPVPEAQELRAPETEEAPSPETEESLAGISREEIRDWLLCGEDAKVWLAIPTETEHPGREAGEVVFIGRWLGRSAQEKPHLVRLTTADKDYCIEITDCKEVQGNDLQSLWASSFAHSADTYGFCLAEQVHAAKAARSAGLEPLSTGESELSEFRRSELAQPGPFEMMSGDAAIKQALMDSLMRERVEPGMAKIDISTIEPMKLQERDWAALAAGKKIDVPNPSGVCPAECFFLTFHDMNRALDFFEFVSDWGTSPLRLASVERGELAGKERTMRLMALRTKWYHRYFYSHYIRSLTLAIGDFYLREMPDLALIFEPQPGKLETVSELLHDSLADAADEAGLQVQKTRIQNVDVEYIESKDGSIRAWHATVEGFVVRASDGGIMRRIIEAGKGVAPSLAKAQDFRYMLALLPYNTEGYAYIGEAFVKRLVSPEFKICELRRTNCAGNMTVMEAAMFAFNAERGRQPRNTEELLKTGFLGSIPVCQQGGTYIINSDGRLECSAHGTRLHLKPLWELSVEKVTKEEAQRYYDFREGYREYWRKYFDPVGAQICVSSAEVSLDLCLTPVAEGYKEMGKYLAGNGETALEVGELSLAVFWGLRRLATMDWDEYAKREQEDFANRYGFDKPLLGWLEAGAIVMPQDQDWETWLKRALFLFRYGLETQYSQEAKALISSLPLAAVFRVNDTSAAKKFLTRLHEVLKSKEWTEGVGPYLKPGPLEERDGRLILRFDAVEETDIRAEFWVILDGERLFLSPNKQLIEKLADSKGMCDLTKKALMTLEGWHIGAVLDLEKLSGVAEAIKRALVMVAAQRCEDERAHARSALRYAVLCEPDKVFRITAADLVKKGLLETEPTCVDGGKLIFGASRVSCTRHTTAWHMNLFPNDFEQLQKASEKQKKIWLEPVSLPKGSRVRTLLERIGAVGVSLRLEEEYLRSRIWFRLR